MSGTPLKIQTLFAAGAAALSLSLPAFAANLVTNGSFENDTVFFGWTQFGNTGDSGVSESWIDGTDPVDGAHQAYFGPAGSNGGIRQDINTTAGLAYNVSFYVRQLSGTGLMDFSANLGGGPTVALSGGPGFDPGKPYTLYQFSVLGTGSPMTLEFNFRNDPAFFLLDNVVVTERSATAIPEPGAWTLMILGFMTAGGMLRRSRRALA